MVVDEFRAVVRIDTPQRKRQASADVYQRFEDPDLGLVDDRLGLGPSTGYVGYIEGLAEVPTGFAAIVPHQVDLHESRLGLVPLGEGANRNLVLEQRPGRS